MAESQGQNAINAGEHFRSLADEAMQRHLEDGQFSGRFRQMFARQAVATGLHFTEQGQAYGRQQKEAWEGSVLKGQLAEFGAQVARNYNNPEWINFNLQALRQRIETMRPALDNREMFQHLDSLTAKGRLDGMLADGRYDEAERLLGGGTGSGGTIAETFRNPLNLKKAGANTGTRDDFRQFGSYAEGFGAAWDQLKIYAVARRPDHARAGWRPNGLLFRTAMIRTNTSRHCGPRVWTGRRNEHERSGAGGLAHEGHGPCRIPCGSAFFER